MINIHNLHKEILEREGKKNKIYEQVYLKAIKKLNIQINTLIAVIVYFNVLMLFTVRHYMISMLVSFIL